MRSLTFLIALSALAQSPEGQRLFVANCSTCHGADAKGARGPDLTSGALRHGSSVTEIAKNIVDGIPGTGMPAFANRSRASRTACETCGPTPGNWADSR